jgi:hypothetical protein
MIEHCRTMAAMRSKSEVLMALLELSSCGGHPRSVNAKQGKADERHHPS